MEIEKAIETLRDVVDCNIVPYPPDFKEAVRMGADALQRQINESDRWRKETGYDRNFGEQQRRYSPDPRD